MLKLTTPILCLKGKLAIFPNLISPAGIAQSVEQLIRN